MVASVKRRPSRTRAFCIRVDRTTLRLWSKSKRAGDRLPPFYRSRAERVLRLLPPTNRGPQEAQAQQRQRRRLRNHCRRDVSGRRVSARKALDERSGVPRWDVICCEVERVAETNVAQFPGPTLGAV